MYNIVSKQIIIRTVILWLSVIPVIVSRTRRLLYIILVYLYVYYSVHTTQYICAV